MTTAVLAVLGLSLALFLTAVGLLLVVVWRHPRRLAEQLVAPLVAALDRISDRLDDHTRRLRELEQAVRPVDDLFGRYDAPEVRA